MNLRNKILIGFLAISLIPIFLIGVIALEVIKSELSSRAFAQLENARDVKKQQVLAYISERQTDLDMLIETVDGLRHAAFDKLRSVQENKKAQILTYFQSISRDLEVLSRSDTVTRAIKDFESTVGPDGALDSLLYNFLETEKYGDTLLRFGEIYGYYDLLLVNRGGIVVYSSHQSPELGQSLQAGPFQETVLSRCFNESLITFNFQDFEPDPTGSGKHLALLGRPIREKNGTILGVVILKITNEAINAITLRHQGMGDTGETWLSGIQGGKATLRSRRPIRGGGIGDALDDSPGTDALSAVSGPRIRIAKQGLTEIVMDEPVVIVKTVYILSTRMGLKEVIDPRPRTEQNYFSRYADAYGYSNLYLISPAGKVFFSMQTDLAPGDIDLLESSSALARLFREIEETRSVCFIDFSLPGGETEPAAYIGAPLANGDTLDMVVALKIPIVGFNTIMKTRGGTGKTSDFYLVGPDRLMRSDSYLLSEYSVSDSFRRPDQRRIETKPVLAALSGETGSTIATDYRNKTVLSAFAPLTFLGKTWAVIAEIDREEAFTSVWTLTWLSGLSVFLTGCVIVLLSLKVSRKVAAPILALTHAAESVKQRNFDISVDIGTRDEFRLLAGAFNSMTATIKDYANSLEQKIDQLEVAEEEVRQSEERFRSLVETTSDWIWEVDAQGRYTYASPRVLDILGYAPEEVIGSRPFDFMPLKERERVERAFNEIAAAGKSFSGLENTNLHRDGHTVVMETSGVPFFSDTGELLGYRGIDRDITRRKRNEASLLLTESVFTNTIEGIAITDVDGVILRVNQAFCDITGYSADEAVGRNPRVLKSDRHGKEFYRKMWQDLLGQGQWSGEIWNRKKDGSAYPEWLSISAIRDDSGHITNFVSLFHDISEKKLKEEQLQFLAFHDPLTRLPNRKLLYDRARVSILNAKRAGLKMALLYMDIDNFKNINDSYGHPFGDEFLIRVKDRIESICRQSDTFARYGGDEFVIVLNNVVSSQDVLDFSNRIIDLFAKPLEIMGEEVYSSISIGLSIFPDDGEDIVTLEKNADMALYEAKKDGKRRSFLFRQTLKDKMLRKTMLENEMRRSVTDFSSFHVLYQPKVDTVADRIYGVEALLRWEVSGSLVSPVEFIPLAEETNMIIPIGEWLMRAAMNDMKSAHDAGFTDLVLSINLSAKQFNDEGLFSSIQRTLDQTGYDPSKLCFEITESIPMESTDRAIEIMETFRSMGISLSMDDFGTGYSSLSFLKRFPLRELKIDRSFINEIPENQNDAAISRTIIQMARSLNFDVVAEGVETREQLAFLRENGCNFVQGFLFYKPLPLDQLTAALGRRPSEIK